MANGNINLGYLLGMVYELGERDGTVYMTDLKSVGDSHAGSSPAVRTKLQEEIDFWTSKMNKTKNDELSFVCWGIVTGLKLARRIQNEQ